MVKERKYVVDIGEAIEDPDSKEKFVTITINKKILHFIFEGLATYKSKFTGEGTSDNKERNDITQLVDEFVEVNNVLNNEIVVKNFGKQEANPVEQTEPI